MTAEIVPVATTDSFPERGTEETYGLVWALVDVNDKRYEGDRAAAAEHALEMIRSKADERAGSGKGAAVVGLRLVAIGTDLIAYGTAVRPGPTGQRQARVRQGRIDKPPGF